MFKPKIKKVDDVDEEQLEEELEEEEVEEEDNNPEEPVKQEQEGSKLTVQEVVDMLEGHISRSHQLLQLLK